MAQYARPWDSLSYAVVVVDLMPILVAFCAAPGLPNAAAPAYAQLQLVPESIAQHVHGSHCVSQAWFGLLFGSNLPWRPESAHTYGACLRAVAKQVTSLESQAGVMAMALVLLVATAEQSSKSSTAFATRVTG